MSDITSSQVKARVSHVCDFCYRTIEPRENYTRTVSFEDGVSVWKSCDHCEAMIRLCGIEEWNHGDGLGPDNFSEMEPRDTFEERCLEMWHEGWRRKDGTLYPVPDEVQS
jgi:hypothetical protein